MGAAGDEGVDALEFRLREVVVQGGTEDFRVRQAFFDDGHQKGRGQGVYGSRYAGGVDACGVDAAADGSAGTDDADVGGCCLGAVGLGHGGNDGVDDVDDGDVRGYVGAERVPGHGRCGIAGHNNRNGSMGQEVIRNGDGVGLYGFGRFVAVGKVRRVSKVEELAVRKALRNRAGYGETADAGHRGLHDVN